MAQTPIVKKKIPAARKPAPKAAAKKVAVKKTVAAGESATERNLAEIFDRLRGALAPYAPPYTVTLDRPGRYELWSQKEIVLAGRKRSEMFFAGLIWQSNYVGLYYMPIYVDTSLGTVFSPRLTKLLKGKSCFHVKTLDDDLLRDVVAALKAGHALYKRRGWV